MVVTLAALTASAQQFTIPFSGGGRPPVVRVTLLNGGIEINGYEGKDVILESGGSRRNRPDKDGLRRIDIGDGYSINEDNNVITIHGSGGGSPHLVLRVPFQTGLEVKCMNCSETKISNVAGDVDVNTTNSGVRLTNVSGAVLAHSLNNRIYATFDRVPAKPVSLSSMNGSIDLTVPGDTKAELKLKTQNGKIHTDFDLRLAGGTVMQPDRGLTGTINGGGIELRLNSFNGSIYLRRK